MQQAIAYALDHDVVVVAAAGNQNEYITYPAAYPGVLAVSALTPHLRRAEFAHGGDIVAPGVDIRNVAAGGSGMRSDEGTSTAAPQVSAAAGIIRSLRPDFNALQTRELILSTTQDLGAPGFDDEFGYGMLDIAQILRTLNDPDVTNRGGIRGHIDGIDAQRVSIELVDYQLIAPDASGNFAITGLPAGNYMLQIIGNDSALIATPLPVTVSGIGLTPINISIVVDAPYATITQPVP
jgi:subtilisin family serine protease